MVVIRQSVLDEVHRHGRSTPDVEVCGVFVGRFDEQANTTLVEAAIRGESARSMTGSVTFTAQTWVRIHDVIERDYPDLRIVGWYHTHPDFGVFLSEMDQFIHRQFFEMPWQVAFVYDPVRNEEGLFTWQGDTALPDVFTVQPNMNGGDHSTTESVNAGLGGRMAEWWRRVVEKKTDG